MESAAGWRETGAQRRLPCVPVSNGGERVNIELSGGFPLAHLDRLLRTLEPVLYVDEPTLFTLDLRRLVFLGPTAQAVVAAVFHRIVSGGLAANGSAVIHPSRQVMQYLQRMDFFEPFIGHLPEDFVRHEPTGFRPLQHFTDGGSCIAAGRELRDAVVEACDLEDERAVGAIHLCLGELAENVLFHADTPLGGFAAAQGWKKKATVEVTIVDMGIGIRKSLTKNEAHADISTDTEAIEKALEPMVSGIPDPKRGLGLSVTRFLLRRNGGSLMIRSGEGAVYAGTDERSERCESAFPGTIVSLTARTDQPLDSEGAWDDIDRAEQGLHDDD